MKTKIFSGVVALATITAMLIFFKEKKVSPNNSVGEEEYEAPAEFVEARMKYEFDMLKDPVTGTIPKNIFEKEIAFAKTLPVRSSNEVSLSPNGSQRLEALNSYIPAGPNNIGGRTRAIAYDVRFNGGGNRVVIAGCVSGGIMRSTDGGISWTLVTPASDIHNLTAITQDSRNGFQDTWYAGGGESSGNSTSEIGATYLGYGIWKSINNGATWTKLTLSVTDITGATLPSGALEVFDNAFDYVHAMKVNPANGDLYITGHRRLIRSTNGGSSFQVVFGSSVPANSINGQMDVAINAAGRVYLAVNGGNPDATLRGVWFSPSGNQNSFVRIAGGSTLGVDSVDGWRANDYSASASKRILLTLAPSDNNIAYVYYENGLSNDDPDFKPEADLFRLDISGTTFTWSNRSANLPDFPGGNLVGSDPLAVQGGYDMLVKVKPNNANIVFISGTNLYRSTDGFASSSNTTWIGGYRTDFTYGQYPNSHADMHQLAFNPSNPNESICGNDGGIQITSDNTAATISWSFPANYQTLQYYNVAIDPGAGRNNFAGGAQDNGVRFRDKTGILGTPASDSNNHRLLFSADGAYVGISSLNGTNQNLFESIQLGRLYRFPLGTGGPSTEITPDNLTTASTDAGPNEFGEFVTNLRLVADNSEDLYYINFNRLFRTTSASTVTKSTWTELTGVSAAVNPADPTGGRNIGIRGITNSRGPYTTSHTLYFGTTNGKIFRLDDPRNTLATTIPINITPPGLTGNVQDIAVNPNNDDEVLAVVSNYGTTNIWWTANGKSATPNWINAEGNLTLPSIRSCVIVVKKDGANNPVTEYYVGTSVGLYSTTNISAGSPTWQREGGSTLNFAVVQSLAYRPVDNVLALGTHGNGMYYTFLGTPNFVPNQNTAINPVTNDKSFIKNVFPTITLNNVQYQTGNMFGIRKIIIQLTDFTGRLVYKEEASYRSGNLPLSSFASGAYILSIYSDDNKYRHIQKIIKQ